MTMINPDTFIAAAPRRTTKGTVEVTINGKTIRLYAIRASGSIQVWGILGRLKGDERVWELRVILRRKRKEYVEEIVIYNTEKPPSLEGKTWDSFEFGPKIWRR